MTSIVDENLSVTRSLNSSWWEALRRLRKFPPSSRRQRCFRCGELCPVGPSRETGKTTRLLPLHQRPGRLPWRRSGSLPRSLPCRIIFLHYFNEFNRNVRDLPFFFFLGAAIHEIQLENHILLCTKVAASCSASGCSQFVVAYLRRNKLHICDFYFRAPLKVPWNLFHIQEYFLWTSICICQAIPGKSTNQCKTPCG